MICKKNKIIILIAAAILISGGIFFKAGNSFAESRDINVGITVPGGGGGGGGGTPATDNFPVISNVSTSVSFTSASVTWNATDDKGISAVAFEYGLSNTYGTAGTISAGYQVSLSGLTDGTLYYYKISVTDTASQVTNYTGTFNTLNQLVDTTPPVIINIQVLTGMTTATISWDTDELSDSQVNYGTTPAYGNTISDVSKTLSHSSFVTNLLPNTLYHYRIISTDPSGNSASTTDAVFTTQKDNIPPPDVSNLSLTTTSDSINLSWENPLPASVPDFAGVKILRKTGSPSLNPGDGTLVYTGAGEAFSDSGISKNINYYYTVFSFDTSGNYSPGIYRNGMITSTVPPSKTEVCNNGIDDDGNGLVDCDDPACASYPACQNIITPPATSTPPAYSAPSSTVPSFAKISLKDLIFLSGNRQITLVPMSDVVSGLPGTSLSLVVPERLLAGTPKSMVVVIGADLHQFAYSLTDKSYYSDFTFPYSGQIQAYLEIDYGSGQFDSVEFKLNSLPWGLATDDSGNVLQGTEVDLYKNDGSRMPMETYGQANPFITDANGSFGWIVPNGEYYLTAQKTGYYKYTSPSFTINANIYNSRINLIKQPPPILNEVSTSSPLINNVANVAKNLASQAKAVSQVALQTIGAIVQNPDVQKTTENIVAPAAITIVAVGALSLISWLDILPLLQLLFLQPFLLIGRRKREKWGFIYNSLNKLPVDLAIVRLINAENGRVVQSKVTDQNGHYMFIADPGNYKLEVRKNNFVFPSSFLAGYKTDGERVDIYHGEIIEVTDKGAVVAVNVPLDPAGATKGPSRLVWERIGRKIQKVLSWAGVIITAISLYISPKWYIAVFLALQIILFFLFRRLAVPPKTKSWGIVYDQSNKQPISKVVARLFNSQFNKLVSTQITDNKGRYSFLAGDDRYYVTYEHKEYQPLKTNTIDLAGKKSDAIAVDVQLKKH